MTTLPSLIIIADRGRLLAYLVDEDSTPLLHSTTDIREGHDKISELVTDQAGAFLNTGNVGTSAGERLPLERELKTLSIRRLVASIEKLLVAEGVPIWGFAAPPDVLGATLDLLKRELLEPLALRVPRDLVNASPRDVKEVFEAEQHMAVVH